MAAESLNCPNCGAGVASDRPQCDFCKVRLKTVACTSCLGLMFDGAKFCGRCGKKVAAVETLTADKAGDCPRCKRRLGLVSAGGVTLRECGKCAGMWADADTFESVCAEAETRSAVLGYIVDHPIAHEPLAAISYVPCPECGHLMNRSNFARSSGVIVDICKQHGVWFDRDELPSIVNFIERGGLELARKKERADLDAERRKLRDEMRQQAVTGRRFGSSADLDQDYSWGVRGFIRGLFR
jgi:Zn-finger nucleic acid-binding protein